MISRELVTLFFITFFVGQSVSLISPILPSIRNEFNLSYAAVSSVLALFGLSRLLTSLPVGYLYHRINSKKLLLTGLFLIFAGSGIAFLTRSLAEFFISQIITGVGFSFCTTTIIISLSLATRRENIGRVLGFNTLARSSAAVAAPVMAGLISALFLWRSVFAFYFLLSIITFCLALFFVSHKTKSLNAADIKTNTGGRYTKHAIGSLLLTGFLASFATVGFRATVVPLFARDALGMDVAAIGLVLGVSAILHFITAPVAAIFSDRYGRKKFLLFGLIAQMIGLLYFLYVKTFFDLIISAVFLGIGTMIFVLPPAILADVSSVSKMSRNQSMLRFMIDLGFFAGPFAMGIILDGYGFSAAALVTTAFTLVTLVTVIHYVKEK